GTSASPSIKHHRASRMPWVIIGSLAAVGLVVLAAGIVWKTGTRKSDDDSDAAAKLPLNITAPETRKSDDDSDAAAELPLNITAPVLEADRVVRPVPEPFRNLALGGGGRYFILHLPKSRKLAVFDVNQAAITQRIPVAEENVSFAAGLDKLVVVL